MCVCRSHKDTASLDSGFLITTSVSSKDTWRSLGAAHHVDTGGDDVGCLATAGQVFHERHLVEVEGCVQTALVHLQLVTQSVDAVLRWREKKHVSVQKHAIRRTTNSDM